MPRSYGRLVVVCGCGGRKVVGSIPGARTDRPRPLPPNSILELRTIWVILLSLKSMIFRLLSGGFIETSWPRGFTCVSSDSL